MVAIAPLRRQRHYLPELVLTHAEEAAYLWGRRRTSLHSETLQLRNLQELQERIEAHLQGMLIAGADLPALLGEWLQADDRDEVFAAACALLRHGDPAFARQVLAAFSTAQGPRLAGLRDAFGASPQTHTQDALAHSLAQGDSAHAAAAAAALASQRRLAASDPALIRLLGTENSTDAALAWRALTVLDPASATLPYREALQAADGELRAAALTAACWRGEAWAAKAIHKLAEDGDLHALGLWAATAEGATLASAPPQPALDAIQRCKLAARCGHPEGIAMLIAAMADADARLSAAAGTAFTRITGCDVEGERKTLPVSADADDFEREFTADVHLGDDKRAQQRWAQHGEQWRAGRRWNRGHEVSATLSTAAQAAIDLAARWDFGLRAALAGVRLMAPPPVI